MKTNKGFTLIELLIVVLIIGILAAIAVPQYQKAVGRSKFVQLKAMAEKISDAQSIYFLANGKYATKFKDLDITMPGNCMDYACFYDWGICYLEGQIQVVCYINGATLQYQIEYNNKKRKCISFNTDEMSEKICQIDSNVSSYNSGTYKIWYYN